MGPTEDDYRLAVREACAVADTAGITEPTKRTTWLVQAVKRRWPSLTASTALSIVRRHRGSQ